MKRVKMVVDSHSVEADASTNVLQGVLGAGLNLPYFCWHPALGSVGACRQCAVIQYKDENDTQGRLVMACMTPCAEGSRFSIDHPDARDMRSSVVEFLMTNHPHDCPVCEEGGHCHLQDMTVMTGHNYRRYRFTKRTHRNQDLGPFVSHEMNRCIACYRCVRYYRDYAGGKDLDNYGAGADVYFGRAQDGTLESPFAGNLVEVCPTGVFTDKPYGESYTRKWDLQTAPSVCAHCSVGCNTTPGERYGRLKRLENRYHGDVNGYFICDRGRYGWGFVNRADRPRQPLLKRGSAQEPIAADDLVAHVASLVKAGGVLAIGSPRASLETNHALKTLAGEAHFSTGLAAADGALTELGIEILQNTPASIASIRDAEKADAVLVLGEDVINTGARVGLALRQATRQAGFKLATANHVPHWQDASVRTLTQSLRSPLFVVTAAPSELDEIAAASVRAAPAEAARLGAAVAHAIDGAAPAVAGLDAKASELVEKIAKALLAAERPLVVSGTGSGSAEVLQAAANVASALKKAGKAPAITLVFAEANSVGLGLLGGLTLDHALKQVEQGEVDTLIVAENDLYRRAPAARIDAALAKLKHVVVLDCIGSPTVARATAVLPAGSFAESDGTLVNNEGRAQRYFQVFVPEGPMRESWRWLQQVAAAAGIGTLGETLDPLTQGCALAHRGLAAIVDAAPNAKFRMSGAKIPRQPHRFSGRTAMHANKSVHEPRPPQDGDTPLAFSMEGMTGLRHEPAPLIPMFWAPMWNSPQAVNKFQAEIGGPLQGGDPGVKLIAPNGSAKFYPAPAAPARGLAAAPVQHIFGSEELSALAPVMNTRLPQAHLAVSPATASQASLADGGTAELTYDSMTVKMMVKVVAGFADQCVGFPAGVAGVPFVPPGAPVALVPGKNR